MRAYSAILELGDAVNDFGEAEYYLLLRSLCAADEYAHLRTVLHAMRDGLPAISRASADLLQGELRAFEISPSHFGRHDVDHESTHTSRVRWG